MAGSWGEIGFAPARPETASSKRGREGDTAVNGVWPALRFEPMNAILPRATLLNNTRTRYPKPGAVFTGRNGRPPFHADQRNASGCHNPPMDLSNVEWMCFTGTTEIPETVSALNTLSS